MATPRLTEEQCRRTYDVFLQCIEAGYRIGGTPGAATEAARILGLGTGQDVWRHINRGVEEGWWEAPKPPEPDDPDAPSPLEERREKRDAEFWRRTARRLEKDLAASERALEELAGVRDQTVTLPRWLVKESPGPKRRAVLGLLLSDLHVGEVVRPEEVLGINEYNIPIFRERFRRLIDAAIKIGPRWAADCKLQGMLLVLGGDLISGDIHDELVRTNELTAHRQVRVAVEEISAGLKHLVEAFGKVHVVSVPGNHGRTTRKPTAKLYSQLSYDTMAADMVRDRFADDKRITWQISDSIDAVTPVLGRRILTTHGDNMGTGGGKGFIGPGAPILRGANLVRLQQDRIKRGVDLILHGHYHTSMNPGAILSNGSFPGYTEYGNGLRASVEPPQQWLFLFHERWGLRDRSEVKLEEPTPPPPVETQTIPSEMAE